MKFTSQFFLLFLSATCFGQTLNLEESSVLKIFFQTLTEESEMGYVLFDKKPVCIHGYYLKDPFRVDTSCHKQSVALREGARIWQQLAPKNSDILVHVCNKEDPLIPGYIHLLAIHIPLFHRTINENLSVFQYVLHFIAPQEDFHIEKIYLSKNLLRFCLEKLCS